MTKAKLSGEHATNARRLRRGSERARAERVQAFFAARSPGDRISWGVGRTGVIQKIEDEYVTVLDDGWPADPPMCVYTPPFVARLRIAHLVKPQLVVKTAASEELLVLSGRGIRFGVPGHYGLLEEMPTLEAAIALARANLANGHACACVAIRIEAKLIDGIGEGTDRELVRFEVYSDRVILVPRGQGGLSNEQAAKARALPKKGLL